ncbi:MAG: glycoside hydrolase family 97 protein [Muribaculaceae bacterium]|nr:glycoside hydrolase family 97 protein [Muribaculaceae bacterium]
MKILSTVLTGSLLVFAPLTLTAKEKTLASPDGKIILTISENTDNGVEISISDAGKTLLNPSPVNLDIRDSKRGKIKSFSKVKTTDEMITAPFHHTPEFQNLYNELTAKLDNGQSIEFRVFNNGIAYRYTTQGKGENIVDNEVIELNLPDDPKVYLSHSTNEKNPVAMAFQNRYSVTPLSSADPLLAFLPATVDYGNGLKMTILESDVESYPGMFVRADSISGKLKGVFAPYPSKTDYYRWRKQEFVTGTEDYIARTQGERTYPWRIFAITGKDTEMPVNNLVYALASPSRIDDISWVKPGKSAWEWWNDWGLRGVPFKAGINNETYRYFIDFAAKNGIEYVVLDEGWYVPESGDMLTTIPEIDLPMLAAYAEETGVGLWLWTVFNVLDSQLEEACKKYSEMGIKGFKVDFLDRNDQAAVDMTYRILEGAAKNNMMLDLHGFYTPTGFNRTYPNVVNYESVFGMEEMKWSSPTVDMPEYDVTFPFIRLMAGPVDFTPGAMRNATRQDYQPIYSNPLSQGTRTHQMAHYIVHDTPFTMLADSPSNYIENQECTNFITSVPSVFDETRILDGELGEYIVTLRRDGDNWFIGGETDWNPRDYTLDFSFLPEGEEYEVTLVTDGINADKQAEDYKFETFKANCKTRKPLRMASGGGFVGKAKKI